jgi:RNA polymerase sigma-70 factor (ECF subfamily)
LQQRGATDLTTAFDEELHSGACETDNPERLAMQHADAQVLREALEALPVEFREVIVLRDLEGLSYKEIAAVAAVPLGTVMSRLARARQRLQLWLAPRMSKER